MFITALLTDSNLGFLLISFEKVKVQFVCNASSIKMLYAVFENIVQLSNT